MKLSSGRSASGIRARTFILLPLYISSVTSLQMYAKKTARITIGANQFFLYRVQCFCMQRYDLRSSRSTRKNKKSHALAEAQSFPARLKYALVIPECAIPQPYAWLVLEGTVRVPTVLHDCRLQLDWEQVGRKADEMPERRPGLSFLAKPRLKIEKTMKP